MAHQDDYPCSASPAETMAHAQGPAPKINKSRWRLKMALIVLVVNALWLVAIQCYFPGIIQGTMHPMKNTVSVNALGRVTGVRYLSGLGFFDTQVDTAARSVLLRGVFNVANGVLLEVHTDSSESRICEVGREHCAHWYGAHD
jgi:hypothetical protein